MKFHDISTSFMTSATPAAVVFDLGNVLIDWQPYAAIAAGVGGDEARRFLDADDFDFMRLEPRPGLRATPGTGAEAEVAPHAPALGRACPRLPDPLPRLAGRRGAGHGGIVRELHAAGVPVLGLTNWSHELYPHAPRMFEVLALLDDVVVSGTEGVAKPDARVFEITAQRAGLPLDRLAFVDDRADNVEAATPWGWPACCSPTRDTLRTDLRALGLPV